MKVIVGLGNPGKEYAQTRHNIGFMVIDNLLNNLGGGQYKEKFKAQVAETKIGREKVLLVKPQTYMNASGESVVDIVRFYKIALEDLLVVYDDMDLDLGRLRIRLKGSAGGHNGMKSIIYQLQSDDFPRLRVGIGKAPSQAINYVLGRFREEEKNLVSEAVDKAIKAIETVVDYDVEKAMNLFNG